MPTYHDVYQTPIIGRLNRTSDDEAFSDAARIRTYLRAEKEVAASAFRRKPPPIARAVLTSIWEAPRIDFHREAQKSFTENFRNKLLWAPWSIEAADHWNLGHSVSGLILEHVTPIDAIWRKLKKLDDEFDDPTGVFRPDEWSGRQHVWEHHAASYLIDFWTVAILTAEQASAIDNYKGLRTKGFEPNPFQRYLSAEKFMDRDRARGEVRPSFSTSRFIIPGHANDVTQ